MPVIIEFSRCIGTYSSAKFEYVIRIKNEEGVNYKDLIYIKCNAHVTKIKICIGHFSVEILENVLFYFIGLGCQKTH